MYYEHFGLAHPPFKITPDTRLFYEGGNRGDILDALAYAITSGEGIVKVVGEVGSGKTMLSRMLAVKLPEHVDIAYFANPNLAPEDILYAIAVELKMDLPSGVDRIQALHLLQKTLLERHAQGRQVVCFVEEAQAMPLETLEEIRLLSNLETHVAKLLQIVLFGQPELDENLDEPRIRQLRERIVHSFYLAPLGTMDVSSYVNFRMRAVGYRGPDVFSKGAYKALSRASEGLIRRINIIGDKALLAAYADNSHQVSAKHVRTAIKDSEFGRVNARRRGGFGWSRVGIAVAVLVAVAAGWLAGTDVRVMNRIGALLSAPQTADRETPNVAVAHSSPSAKPDSALTVSPSSVAHHSPAAVVANPSQPAAPAPAVAQVRAVQAPVLFASGVGVTGPTPDAAADMPGMAPHTVLAAPRIVGGDKSPGGATDPLLVTNEAQALALVGFGTDSGSLNEALVTPVMLSVPTTSQLTTAMPEAPAGSAAAPPVSSSPVLQAGKPVDGGAILEARLAATTAWLGLANGDHFSIQLMVANRSKRENLEIFFERWQAERNVAELYVYQTNMRGSVWYGVLLKEYPSLQAAKVALEQMPPALKRHKPFVRNIRDIRAVAAL